MGCLLFAFLSHTFLVLHKPLPDAVHSLNKRIRWNFFIYWFPLRFTDQLMFLVINLHLRDGVFLLVHIKMQFHLITDRQTLPLQLVCILLLQSFQYVSYLYK